MEEMKMPMTPRRLVIATQNQHKLQEILAILREPGLQFLSLRDFPHIPPIEETGSSFQENALLKARTVSEVTGLLTLADDSGLEVDALDGAPGIYSSRYSGQAGDYLANNHKLLETLRDTPDEQRSARFRCVVALVAPGTERLAEGVVQGRIIRELRGTGGFGYDPLFIPEGYRNTFAELGEKVKNRISHRALAFRKVRKIIKELQF